MVILSHSIKENPPTLKTELLFLYYILFKLINELFKIYPPALLSFDLQFCIYPSNNCIFLLNSIYIPVD